MESAEEKYKLEARKILENVADSPASSAYHPEALTGRFVEQFLTLRILFGINCTTIYITV